MVCVHYSALQHLSFCYFECDRVFWVCLSAVCWNVELLQEIWTFFSIAHLSIIPISNVRGLHYHFLHSWFEFFLLRQKIRRNIIVEGLVISFSDGWNTVQLFFGLYAIRMSNCGIDYLKTEFNYFSRSVSNQSSCL